MGQNITLMGASYTGVEQVALPKTGGGTASFADPSGVTAVAADVASGKYFLNALGVLTQGTASGGGGTDRLVTLATLAMGTISTSSTSATDTGKAISIADVSAYDFLIVETSRDSFANGRYLATVAVICLNNGTDVATKNSASVWSKLFFKSSNAGVCSSRQSSSGYGIYPNSCTLTTTDGKTSASIPMYQRYNSTNTGTINGSFTARVYGVNLFDLIGG